MTAPRLRRTRGPFAGMRRGGALMAVLALAGLATLGLPGAARGASPSDSYNQMTGVGTTASAVTVPWTAGLLNAENQPITTPGSELSPNSDRQAFAAGKPTSSSLAFMYRDFKSISVTVSQTQNITHQGITVTWSGAAPTVKTLSPLTSFMQMMECYGDSSSGPDPTQCEFGKGVLPGQTGVTNIGTREGELCPPGSVATAPGGISDIEGGSPVVGSP